LGAEGQVIGNVRIKFIYRLPSQFITHEEGEYSLTVVIEVAEVFWLFWVAQLPGQLLPGRLAGG
jgi:hypothetical protein